MQAALEWLFATPSGAGTTFQGVAATTISSGQPVYVTDAAAIALAQAHTAATKKVVGIIKDATIGAGATGTMQTAGVFNATTAEWDAVTGASGGLTPGAIYYLSEATAGRLTSAVPTSGYLVPIGKALSTTQMKIEIAVWDIQL